MATENHTLDNMSMLAKGKFRRGNRVGLNMSLGYLERDPENLHKVLSQVYHTKQIGMEHQGQSTHVTLFTDLTSDGQVMDVWGDIDQVLTKLHRPDANVTIHRLSIDGF